MKEYESPVAELIAFNNEKIITAVSGCNCFFNIETNNLGIDGDEGCAAMSGAAAENPFGVSAPEWKM